MNSPRGFDLNEKCRDCKLKSSSFFCDLPDLKLKALQAIKYSTGYPEGAVLFMEGEAPRGVLVLCKGRVKLSMTSAEGKTVILRIVKPGEVLGLHAAVSGEPYQSTAETLEPCQVNFIRREDFLRFLREHAEASIRAARQLSNDYHAACERVRSMGLSRSAPEKLAKFVLDWATNSHEPQSGTRIKLTLTHEEIGQMIGTTRETVTRTFSEFKSQQIAALNRSTLVIQNKAALKSLVSV